jgi:benzoate/toluate 1,2-dioxygenase reductase component
MKSTHGGSRVQTFETTVLSRKWVSGKAFELELSRPPCFQFTPGQRVRFIHEKGARDYSPISTPQDAYLLLLIKFVQGGLFSPVLAEAEPGTSFYFTGPMGYFVWLPSNRPAVFVATGTGIAPFVSMARSGVREFTLIHGARRIEDLYYRPFLEKRAKSYVPCLSESCPQADRQAFHGRVTAYIANHLIPATYDFYLCGRGEMIRDVILLVDRLFPGSLVYGESFYD